ncbi:MAG: NAD(P)H-dependent oxidoreductase [Pseudomonadota bacterium]
MTQASFVTQKSGLRDLSAPPMALACSPRAGGNSDTLAMAFAQGFDEASLASSQLPMQVQHLRDYAIRPCMACYACEPEPLTKHCAPCPLGRGPKADHAEQLFHMLMHTPALYMSAPIFFYHLPAHMKAFVDRGQSYWLRRMAADAELCALPARPAWLSLVAARRRGDKLFEGSLVSLRFFLQIFNFVLQEPEILLGYDDAHAIARDTSIVAQTVNYGRRAAQSLYDGTWQG